MKREGQQAGKEKTADVKTFTKMMKLYALLSGVVLIALIILSIVFIKRLKASNTGSKIPSGEVKSSITIQKINGISDDFIKGVDISSLISEEESGVIYYDEDGNKSDLIKILADEGINYIRVRVWNDPYDTHGCGYGGGNCDTEKAAQIGKRAAKYGIKLLVDYHYSDFWADPSKQMSPKAWAHLTWDNKQEAIYTWTRESLKTIIDAGADVGMVQIGNEINNGMAGETDNEKICLLLSQASKAVREISEENGISIKVAVHYTNVSDADGIDKIAQMLAQNNVDYDVFGLSYYIFWHGTIENLQNVMKNIIDNYGKEVMVAETSYCYTLEDGDGHPDSVSEKDLNSNYSATVQSQATALRDVCEAVAEMGEKGLGVFYWEPAWIPVAYYDPDASDADTVLAQNKIKWEKFGSGWASSYAVTYDPSDAGVYYGGSAWDNQAWFDFTGHPLATLYVYKYLKYGSTSDLKVDFLKPVTVNCNIGAKLSMPETVEAVYNDRMNGQTDTDIDEIHLDSISSQVPVTWNADDIAAIDTSKSGDYTVRGTLTDGSAVNADVHVAYVNLISNESFEDKDFSMWNIDYKNTENPTDYQNKEADAYDGTVSLHFWAKSESPEFTVSQTLSDVVAGTYQFYFYAQGGDIGKDAQMYAFVDVNGKEYRQDFTLSGWVVWQNPVIKDIVINDGDEVKAGAYIKTAAGGWGTLDGFYFGIQPQ